MNLIRQFQELDVPITQNQKLFHASTLKKFPFSKIGVNNEGYPVILISSISDPTYLSQKNVRLKYLELTHNLECKVSENGNSRSLNLTLIVFKSKEYSLQSYFLGIVGTLLGAISSRPTQQEIFEKFKNFIEIFSSLSESPTKTLQGLWAELLLIERGSNPGALLNFWHNLPEEKFDFNADFEKLEVKSTSSLTRVHIFAAEQLNPPSDQQVIIASVFTKQTSNGLSVIELIELIEGKVAEIGLKEKLYSIVSKTLGNTFEQAIKIKYDYDLAVNSVRFYSHHDISKIEKLNIPQRVSDVKYQSDLTDVKFIVPNNIQGDGMLFKSI